MNRLISKTMLLIALCVSALTLFTHTTPSTQAQTGGTFDLIGHFGGETRTVFVEDNIIYIGMGGVLAIMDISDPANPTLLGKTNPLSENATIQDIEVVEDMAYIADYYNGLMIVDVSDPASPALVGSYDTTTGYASGIQIAGSVAYIAYGSNGLVIIDVSDPASPALVSSYNTEGSARGVHVVGSVAYIADRNNGLVTIDVSDPAAPTFVGSYNTAGSASEESVHVVGSVAYIADGNGLEMVDVSDPASPAFLGSYNTTGTSFDVQVVGSTAHIANGSNGLVTVDVSDPASPAFLGSHDTGYARSLQVVGSVVYIADESDGLAMIEVSDPTAPALVGSYNTAGQARDIQVVGSVAYVANWSNGLVTVDVSDPANPVFVDSYNTAGFATSLQVVEDVAYIADEFNGLVMVDISDPANLVFLGSYNTVGSAKDVDVVGSVAYVVDSNGLVMVDVSDPTDPTLVSSYNTTGLAIGIQVVEGVAYIADYIDGLVMVDVSNPANLVFVGSYNTDGSARDVDVVGSVAYIADGYHGVVTVDVSDPAAPDLLGSYDTDREARDVHVVENIAYIADWYSLVMVDVGDPTAPALVGSYNTIGDAYGVQVVDDVIYVVSREGGLYMLEYVPEPLTPTNTPIPPTDTPTLTNTPIPDGDEYERDDRCVDAKQIETDGDVQRHTFHDVGDVDWMQFETVAGTQYRIEGAPHADSRADLFLELLGTCDDDIGSSGSVFSAGVVLEFVAQTSGTHYVQMRNALSAEFGDDVSYDFSVREIKNEVGAVIIVGGRWKDSDPLQDNIHLSTDMVYNMFKAHEYTDEDITYLATDNSLEGWDGMPTTDSLAYAITDWAKTRVGDGQPLTIYIVSHGYQFRDGNNNLTGELSYYLDGMKDNSPNVMTDNEDVNGVELDGWLDILEEDHPNLVINVIADICFSGGLIEANELDIEDIEANNNRVIITSAHRSQWAYTYRGGAFFSTYFFQQLQGGATIWHAFASARDTVEETTSRYPRKYQLGTQLPQIDDNGNGIGNDLLDGQLAAQRGFNIVGTFDITDTYVFEPAFWPPTIDTIIPILPTDGGEETITADIIDDGTLQHVWAEIYPPSFVAPDQTTGELVRVDAPTIIELSEQGTVGEDYIYRFAENYAFEEAGTYQVVIYAQDDMQLVSQPVILEVQSDGLLPATPLAIQLSGGVATVATLGRLLALIGSILVAGTLTMVRHRTP